MPVATVGSVYYGSQLVVKNSKSVIGILDMLDLLNASHVALDFGDKFCYPGSGVPIYNRAEQLDFVTGDGSTGTTYPTFNGTAGDLSSAEYQSFDGGDYNTLGVSNPAWVNALHKAGAVWGAWALVQFGDTTSQNGILGTTGAVGSGPLGISFRIRSSEELAIDCQTGATSVETVYNTTFGLTAGVPYFVGVSLDETGGAGNSFLIVNDTIETFDGDYGSPSSSDASHTLQIGSRGNANIPLTNNSRLWAAGIFGTTAPTQDQMLSLFQALRGRVGI